MKIKVLKKLGGLANANFLVEINGEEFVFKFLNSDMVEFTSRGFENLFRQIVNKKDCTLQTPECIWKCQNLSIDRFLKDSQTISKKNFLESDKYLGIYFNF